MIAEDAAWNLALADRFYREEFANRPVFLCVDEETLAQLALDEHLLGQGTAGESPVDFAVRGLAQAVRPRVRVDDSLAAWTSSAVAWRRSGYTGPPPFLSVLAVTVLAATTMGGRNDRGYYSRLNDLLGLPGRAMPRYFDSDIQQLWRCLNEWLVDIEHGRRGLPTATNLTSAQSNIGWALSQTVLRASDRARLPLLFRTLGLYPGQQVDGQLLVQGLRRYALAGQGLSRRLIQVLDDPALTQTLAAALAGELAAWNGVLRDESGRRTMQLLLTYHQRSRTFGVAVRTAPDVAGQSIMTAGSVAIPLGETGELQPLSLPVTAPLLEGVSLPAQLLPPNVHDAAATLLRLVMTRSVVRVLTPSDRLARWVEVRSVERNRRHLVVVRLEFARAAVEMMGPLAHDAPRCTSVPCPSGWVAYEYEPVRAGTPGTAVGPLAVLKPRGGEIVGLDGGLAVSARSRLYLTMGPPDVVFDLSGSVGSVDVDGQIVTSAGTAGRLRLTGRGLSEGSHEVNVGGAALKLRLVDQHAVGLTVCSLGTRLSTGISATGRPWTLPSPHPVDSRHDDSGADVVVRGACVDRSSRADALPQVAAGLGAQARVGGRHYALAPGQAVQVLPQPPAWLLGLHPRPTPHMVDLGACASRLPFAPHWFLRIAQGRATVVSAGPLSSAQERDVAEPDNAWEEVLPSLADVVASPGQVEAWTAWLTTATEAPSSAGPV